MSCPVNDPEKSCCGFQPLPSSQLFARVVSLTPVLPWVGTSTACPTSHLSPSPLAARQELLEAAVLKRHSWGFRVRRWDLGLAQSASYSLTGPRGSCRQLLRLCGLSKECQCQRCVAGPTLRVLRIIGHNSAKTIREI